MNMFVNKTSSQFSNKTEHLGLVIFLLIPVLWILQDCEEKKSVQESKEFVLSALGGQ